MTFQPEFMLLLATRKPAQVSSACLGKIKKRPCLYVTLGRSVTGTTISNKSPTPVSEADTIDTVTILGFG